MARESEKGWFQARGAEDRGVAESEQVLEVGDNKTGPLGRIYGTIPKGRHQAGGSLPRPVLLMMCVSENVRGLGSQQKSGNLRSSPIGGKNTDMFLRIPYVGNVAWSLVTTSYPCMYV